MLYIATNHVSPRVDYVEASNDSQQQPAGSQQESNKQSKQAASRTSK